MFERPAVSIVVPFAGTGADAELALDALGAIRQRPGDELVIADNSAGGVMSASAAEGRVRVVMAGPERSSYRARNVGAAAAVNPWLLFLDADCVPEPGILDAYFRAAPSDDQGAIAGEIDGDPRQAGLIARYARTHGHLRQGANLHDRFRPFAVTANLLVRRRAWESIGGFAEGVRSGGDTEFCWRLQEAGWALGYQPEARVLHRHRESLGAFVRATARYAAGRAWLRRRFPGAFAARPGALQAARAAVAAIRWLLGGKRERAAFRALDAVAGVVDVAAERLPNRAVAGLPPTGSVRLVVLVDDFPELSQTFVVSELRALLALGVSLRVEAGRRAARQALSAAQGIAVRYAEDEATTDKLVAIVWLVARHPWRVLRDLAARRRWRQEEPVAPLRRLAPVAWRLQRNRQARLHCHFAAGAALDALRLSALCGRPYSLTAHAYDIFREPRNLVEKLRCADVVTTGCQYNVRYLSRLVAPESRSRIHEIIMGVDPAEFARRRALPAGRTVIGVGRLVEKKGFADLIRAAALLPGETIERLVLVGDGPLRDELQRLADELGVDRCLELRGALDHEHVRDELEQADVLAMPCVVAGDGDRDSMPVVVKEALALGMPVVATDEVGLPEVVRHEWGRLVPPGDVRALADALAELLALPPDRRAEMGAAGRTWVLGHCDVKRETEKLARLLGLIVSGPDPRPQAADVSSDLLPTSQ